MAYDDRMVKRCPISKWDGSQSRCRWCNNPLGPRRRRWCSDQCGYIAQANHTFSIGREHVRKRDGRKCVLCGSTESIEVDHIRQAFGQHSSTSCVHHLRNLRTLCRKCHLVKTKEDRAKVKAVTANRVKRKRK